MKLLDRYIENKDFANLTSMEKRLLKPLVNRLSQEQKQKIREKILSKNMQGLNTKEIPRTYKNELGEIIRAPQGAVKILSKQEIERLKYDQYADPIALYESNSDKLDDLDDLDDSESNEFTRSLRERETIYQKGSGIGDLAPEIMIQSMSSLGLSEIRSLCNANKHIYDICKANKNQIAKYILQNDLGFTVFPVGLDYYHIMKNIVSHFRKMIETDNVELLRHCLNFFISNKDYKTPSKILNIAIGLKKGPGKGAIADYLVKKGVQPLPFTARRRHNQNISTDIDSDWDFE
jgi:hypothetical protein